MTVHRTNDIRAVFFYSVIFVCFNVFVSVQSTKSLPPEIEALDEVHDAEILRAVIHSMAEYTARQKERQNMKRQKRADANVCYGDLGCFQATGPFSYIDMLPNSPEEVGTRFLLYPGRRAGRSTPSMDVPFDNMTRAFHWASKGGFNVSLSTKVIVHGFGSSCSNIWVYEMRSALMEVEFEQCLKGFFKIPDTIFYSKNTITKYPLTHCVRKAQVYLCQEIVSLLRDLSDFHVGGGSLEEEECNIICVDWESGAVIPNYVRAAANTRLVGAQLAHLLRGLNKHAHLPIEKMHLIGFSLGAHVAGFAGSELGGNLSRITGLDPAGPLFESQDPKARLDSSDAHFVDVIHSNGENLILGGLGSWQPMGHVDFYPNGGRMQKGCTNLFVGAVSDIIWSSDLEGRSLCNHRRAYKFFTDSVSPRCHFPAFSCTSYDEFLKGRCFPCTSESKCGNMGYYADKAPGRGQLYLITREEEPFCALQYQVKIESASTASTETPSISYGKILLTIVGEAGLNETFTMTTKDDEELRLGDTLGRILVPHPILGEFGQVEILYNAYSGWLSSGLKKWRIDKVSFTDSFGRSLSVCEKGLILDSGVPVLLSLHAGNCHPTDTNNTTANQTTMYPFSEFGFAGQDTPITTPISAVITKQSTRKSIIHDRNDDFYTNLMTANDEDLTGKLLNVTWKPIITYKDFNSIDHDGGREVKEASRALNTRLVDVIDGKSYEINHKKEFTINKKEVEVMEPILKLSNPTLKHARSHVEAVSHTSEISEPVLGSTTVKMQPSTTPLTTLRYQMTNAKIVRDAGGWIPSKDGLEGPTEEAIKYRQFYGNEVRSKEGATTETTKTSNRNLRNLQDKETSWTNNISKRIEIDSAGSEEDLRWTEEKVKNKNIISYTVQLLPQKLASMLEQAERYARMTIFPLISAHTPKFVTDFVTSFSNRGPKYLPLSFDEVPIRPTNQTPINLHNREELAKTFNPVPNISDAGLWETAELNGNELDYATVNSALEFTSSATFDGGSDLNTGENLAPQASNSIPKTTRTPTWLTQSPGRNQTDRMAKSPLISALDPANHFTPILPPIVNRKVFIVYPENQSPTNHSSVLGLKRDRKLATSEESPASSTGLGGQTGGKELKLEGGLSTLSPKPGSGSTAHGPREVVEIKRKLKNAKYIPLTRDRRWNLFRRP